MVFKKHKKCVTWSQYIAKSDVKNFAHENQDRINFTDMKK
jgi:hypothetical protein